MDDLLIKKRNSVKIRSFSLNLRSDNQEVVGAGRTSQGGNISFDSFKVMNHQQKQRRKSWIGKINNVLMGLMNNQPSTPSSSRLGGSNKGFGYHVKAESSSTWNKVKKSLKERGQREGWKGGSLARMIVEQGSIKVQIPEVEIRLKPMEERKVRSSTIVSKVPCNMRQVHGNAAFDPKLVSIGPFHRDKSHLKPMEEHKMRLICNLLGWIYEPSNTIFQDILIEDLACPIKEMEVKARKCYSGSTYENISSSEFVRMLIIDGCFILELFQLYAKQRNKEYIGDPIFTTPWMVPDLQRDLLLLENQLPYFVLEKLFELTRVSDDHQGPSLSELTLGFFDPLLPREKSVLENCQFHAKPHHLLDLFRSSFVLSFKDKRLSSGNSMRNTMQPVRDQKQYFTQCATELSKAGAKFTRKSSESQELLDIQFNDGALEIPTVYIDGQTGQVLLNFISYEQSDRHSSDPYFTHYVLFLRNLITSSNDVELLQKHGVINHVLEWDADLVDLFQQLSNELLPDIKNCYLSSHLREINRHYRTNWVMQISKWITDNFSNHWVFFTSLVVIVLVYLIGIKTYSSSPF
ncbi:hypothetical protein MKX01_030490 [Papaver californicum]|nr:hypothetical protein MKX01_030490 [Papaver californicum]